MGKRMRNPDTDSTRLRITRIFLVFMLGSAIHVSEAGNAGTSTPSVMEERRPESAQVQRGRRLRGPPLTSEERKEKWRDCLLDLQAEYRQLVGRQIEGKNAILVDMVEHWNLGDSFIQYGEQLLLEQMGSPIQEVCSLAHCSWKRVNKRLGEDPRPGLLLIHGGGNFGDIWPRERKHHRDIINSHPDIPIVWLPQTVYYQNLKLAQSDAQNFSVNSHMHMFVRDLRSLAFLQRHFSKYPSELCPDAAFNIGPIDAAECQPTVDVLILARNDREKVQKSSVVRLAVQFLEEHNRTYSVVDWPCGGEPKLPEDRVDHAKFKFELGKECLCRGRIIVTDRLHAVILATLLGLPHVFLDNSYGKIHAYREAHFKRRELCSNANLNAHRASSWHAAMKAANQMLKERL